MIDCIFTNNGRTEVSLGQLTVFVGQNGSGKSHILDQVIRIIRSQEEKYLEHELLVDGALPEWDLTECATALRIQAAIKTTALADALQRILTNVKSVRVERTGEYSFQIDAEILGGTILSFEKLGDGALEVLKLLTACYAPISEQAVIVINDLGRHLHPKAQELVVAEIRAALKRHPGLQVLATTHCPFVVNEAGYEAIRVLRLDANTGATRCAPLTSAPGCANMRKIIGAGEFWMTVGEDWVR